MKSIKVKRLLTKKIKKIERQYTNLLEEFELEEIHNFRVEIKKLRAFLRLMRAAAANDERVRMPEKMRAFYRTTGTIRNLQLHTGKIIQLCKDMNCDTPCFYLNLLKKEETKQKEMARSQATNFSLNKVENKIRKAMPKKLNEAAVQNFLQQKKEELLMLLFAPAYLNEDLHHIRKVLKDILYVWPIIRACETLNLPDGFTDKKFLESFTVKLGDFQDSCVALNFFEPSYTDGITAEREIAANKILKHYFICTRRMLKEEIEAILMSSLLALKTNDQLQPKAELI